MYNAGKHLRGRKQVDFDATDFLQQSQSGYWEAHLSGYSKLKTSVP